MTDSNRLYENINAKVHVTREQFEILKAHFKRLEVPKKTKLIQEGESNDRLYYVESGLLYSYKTLESGDYQVIQFAKEDNWLSDLCSFFSGSKALFSVQALEDCSLYTLTKRDFDELCSSHRSMETFLRLNFQFAYVSTLIRLSDAYSQDTRVKYDKIRESSPDLLQRIPQYLIASYLGVLPSSLSRIRSQQ